jgi:hypothetical protein
MRPTELSEAVADIMTKTCKRVFRAEEMTWDELDRFADRVMMLCEDEKAKLQMEREIDRAEQMLDARKEEGK